MFSKIIKLMADNPHCALTTMHPPKTRRISPENKGASFAGIPQEKYPETTSSPH
jgi:hypothetical protein